VIYFSSLDCIESAPDASFFWIEANINSLAIIGAIVGNPENSLEKKLNSQIKTRTKKRNCESLKADKIASYKYLSYKYLTNATSSLILQISSFDATFLNDVKIFSIHACSYSRNIKEIKEQVCKEQKSSFFLSFFLTNEYRGDLFSRSAKRSVFHLEYETE